MSEVPAAGQANIVRELIRAHRQLRGDTREAEGDMNLGIFAFARDMDVSVTAVQKWIDRNEVPPLRVRRAFEISGGAVPLHRIRPDMYAAPSPDLANTTGAVA